MLAAAQNLGDARARKAFSSGNLSPRSNLACGELPFPFDRPRHRRSAGPSGQNANLKASFSRRNEIHDDTRRKVLT